MPRQDVSEERRAQILEAALEVFARQGFHDARMDDIAQASGLSKGALYLYYKSKDAIIGALMRTLFSVVMRGVRTIEQSDQPARDRILLTTNRFADEMERFAGMLPVMLEFYAVAARDRTVRVYLREMYVDYTASLARVIEQGMARGEFRAGDDAESLATALIGMWEGISLMWAMAPETIRWRETAVLAVTTMLDGLRPPAG
ncbi:MAG: TetR/AcrR family transcriptional regulator [Chloroflexota bacterium]|nr:TetR/AcrR family transcriptional regulator [Chloroflexota bacterium]